MRVCDSNLTYSLNYIPLLNSSLQKIPHWPGLNNFCSLGSTGEFADGTKFEDLSKVH